MQEFNFKVVEKVEKIETPGWAPGHSIVFGAAGVAMGYAMICTFALT